MESNNKFIFCGQKQPMSHVRERKKNGETLVCPLELPVNLTNPLNFQISHFEPLNFDLLLLWTYLLVFKVKPKRFDFFCQKPKTHFAFLAVWGWPNWSQPLLFIYFFFFFFFSKNIYNFV
jgi:hypothetical protein